MELALEVRLQSKYAYIHSKRKHCSLHYLLKKSEMSIKSINDVMPIEFVFFLAIIEMKNTQSPIVQAKDRPIIEAYLFF